MDDKEKWDDFIEKSPYGLLFHKWDFLKIVEKHSNQRLLPYGIYRGENLICVSPLFFKKEKELKMVFSPPPQMGIPYLGIVMSNEYDTLKQNKKEGFLNVVADEIVLEIKNYAPNYIYFSTHPGFLDIRPFRWNGYAVEIYYTYIIDLNGSIENIWNGVTKQTRKDIGKTNERIRLENNKSVDIFYKIMVDRYREQGLNYPIISASYLKDLIDTFKNNISLYFAYCDDEIVGSCMVVHYKDRYITWMGGAKPKNNIHANEHITWELIKLAKSGGYTKFELQGAGMRNLCLFKSKFNPSLEISFGLYKKDTLGKIAEWLYLNFKRKKWF